MASLSPVQTPVSGRAGFQAQSNVRGGVVDNTQVLSTNGEWLTLQNLKLSIYFFPLVSDGDTWDSGSTTKPPRKPLACGWQGDDVDDDLACAFVTDIGGIGSSSAIEFQTSGANKTGWLWVLHQE